MTDSESRPARRISRFKWAGAVAGGLALVAAAWTFWRWQPEPWTRAHLEEAATLAKANKLDAARAQLRIVLRRLPHQRDARWHLIQLEMQQRRLEQAYLELKAFTELFPLAPEGWATIASLLTGGGLVDEAETALDHAVDAAPEDIGPRAMRARVRMRRGRFLAAALDARFVLERAPADAALWALLSQADSVLEGPAAGIATAGRGLAATANDPQLRVALARRHAEAGQHGAAIAQLERLIAETSQTGEARSGAAAIDARLALARLKIAARDTDGAASLLDGVLQARPNDPEALSLRALIDASKGLVDAAITTLDNAMPFAPILRRLRMRLDELRKDGPALRAMLHEAASLKPLTAGVPPEPQRIKRSAARQRGEFTETHAMVWPGNLAVLRREADQRTQQKQWDEARAVAARAEQTYPGTVIGPWILGVVELAQNQPAAAEPHFRTALARAPRAALIAKGLAQAWTQQGGAAKAGEKLEELARADPGFAFARRHAANSYLNARRPDLAEAALRAGTAAASTTAAGTASTPLAAPGNAGPWRDLAFFYLEVDRAGDALQVCAEGLARFPDDRELRSLEARIHARAGDADTAITLLEPLVERAPDRSLDAITLARLLAQRGDAPSVKRALALVQQVERDGPTDLAVIDGIGWTLQLAGEPRRAVPWLETAAHAGPDRPELRYHLGVAYAKSGRRKEARAELEAALRIGTPFPEQPEAQKLLRDL